MQWTLTSIVYPRQLIAGGSACRRGDRTRRALHRHRPLAQIPPPDLLGVEPPTPPSRLGVDEPPPPTGPPEPARRPAAPSSPPVRRGVWPKPAIRGVDDDGVAERFDSSSFLAALRARKAERTRVGSCQSDPALPGEARGRGRLEDNDARLAILGHLHLELGLLTELLGDRAPLATVKVLLAHAEENAAELG
jgi:hypothetical protein